jgi:hypothetical protein
MMKKYNMSTIEKFFLYCQKEFDYGWIDQEGKSHEGVNDGATYSLQSPKELMNSKLGICWDRTELYRDYFKNMTNLKYETYYLLYEDGAGCPSHTILIYYNNNKVYWFEPMFDSIDCYYSGIHEYNNRNDLLNDFKITWIKDAIISGIIPKNYKEENIFIYRYSKPKYHINGYEMREHINNSNLIKL